MNSRQIKHVKTSAEKLVLLLILEQCEMEKSTATKMTQTYIAEECCINKSSVNRVLKSLSEQGFLTYKRGLYKNLTTTDITLQQKAIDILNISQNKTHIPTIISKPNKQHIAKDKVQENALNEAKECISKEIDTNISNGEEIKREINKLSKPQQLCLIDIMHSNTLNPTLYIDNAISEGVPNYIIDYILKSKAQNNNDNKRYN